MKPRRVQALPLTAEAFAPFGVVIETGTLSPESINDGNALKFADLMPLDCSREGGRVAVHLYRSRARKLPLEVRCLERHPLGTQAFWPLQNRPYLLVVAAPGSEPGTGDVCAFVAGGHQAIQYHRNTWHHYQVSLEADSDYLVLDRDGPGNNCEEVTLTQPVTICLQERSSDREGRG